MKYFLIPLALVCGSALACPGADGKDSMALTDKKPVLASKAPPAPSPLAAGVVKASPVKAVPVKATVEPRKTASL